MTEAASAQQVDETETRVSVLEGLRLLLAERQDAAVIDLVSKLVRRNADLERALAQLGPRRRKGEGISSEQLNLFLKALGADPDAVLQQANEQLAEASKRIGDDDGERKSKPDDERPPKQPPVRRPPPPNLRRVENLLPVPDGERPCPVCGTARACIGHEVTEIIDLIPAEVIVRLDKREKLVCEQCDGELARAPIGDKVVEGGIYGSRLVAQLLVGKYDDSLPLYRQAQQLERLGLKMPSSSMGDQITWATDLLRPLWRYSIDAVLRSTVMHLDGTSLPVLDREHERGIRLGALWGYVGDEEVALYLYTSTAKKNGQRPGEIGPEDMLLRRRGFTCADASNLFEQSFKQPGIIELGCNMHARRGFIEALDAKDLRAAPPIAAFKKLYEIEDEIRCLPTSEKTAFRKTESKPIYDELIAWCSKYKLVEPPKSPLGQAIGYLLRHRVALMRFLDNGLLPIDNGIVERLHRKVGVGRRNYLFAGSHVGGERAAIAYSILSTCRLIGIDSVAYLADVLPRLARDGVVMREVGLLMPAEWKKAHPPGSAVDATGT